jgi:hemerythrin superfamily protein
LRHGGIRRSAAVLPSLPRAPATDKLKLPPVHLLTGHGYEETPCHPTKERAMSTDAIVLLKNDHKEIRKVFKQFQDAGDDAHQKKNKLVDQMLELLTVHTYIENESMYPRVRELVPDSEDDVLESYEEHHVADVLCMELASMSADDERFTAKTTVLIENVTHHMDEEESDWFPKVRQALGRKQLQQIGAEMLELKKQAPRKPTQPSALKKAIDAVIV